MHVVLFVIQFPETVRVVDVPGFGGVTDHVKSEGLGWLRQTSINAEVTDRI